MAIRVYLYPIAWAMDNYNGRTIWHKRKTMMARISALQAWLGIDSSVITDEHRNAAEKEFLSRWAKGSVARAELAREIGYAGERQLYVAARNCGLLPGGPMKSDGDGAPRKPRGALPVKSAMAICKVLGRDVEDYDQITYRDYCTALGAMGDGWRDMLFHRLGGAESDGGKQFTAWLDYHTRLELEEQRRIERENDPTWPWRLKLDGAKAEIAALKVTLSGSQAKVAELEVELRLSRAGSRRTTGGVLTGAMKKILLQRVHPDKQNGNDPELYTALTQWVNALETVD